MTFSIDVVVVEVKADFDPFGGMYTQVNFGVKLPVPSPPQTRQFPPQPKPTAYKHILHIMIPKEKWNGQFDMWGEYHIIVKDDGNVEIKRKTI